MISDREKITSKKCYRKKKNIKKNYFSLFLKGIKSAMDNFFITSLSVIWIVTISLKDLKEELFYMTLRVKDLSQKIKKECFRC